MVPETLGVHCPFNLDSELLPSLSAAAMFPFGRAAMEGLYADPSKSESSAQLSSISGG